MSAQAWWWTIFIVFVLGMLILDVLVFNRRSHEVKLKEALLWSAFWVGLALLFNLAILIWKGQKPALEFLTGYLIEQSLSVDNLFVFIMIFSYFRVPKEYQHKILFWGILGAQVMRAIFIFAGVALIHKFEWIIYIFGLFLVLAGIRMGVHKDEEIHPERNPVLKLFRRFMPVTTNYEQDRFFIKKDNKTWATPLFITLLMVETTDVVFAVDSIPAVLAITLDPFIVYTSNIFAILGLRALYFALAGIMPLFHYLHYGLSVILVFVGLKMIASHFIKISTGISLGFVVGILIISVVASLLKTKSEKK
ncbi:MAG: TerC family protein [Candidatus Omnitrophota bacterium]